MNTSLALSGLRGGPCASYGSLDEPRRSMALQLSHNMLNSSIRFLNMRRMTCDSRMTYTSIQR
jgi:hypothetical protein